MAKFLRLQNNKVADEYTVDKAELSIGRANDNDIVIDDRAVSGHHAIIIVAQSQAIPDKVDFIIKDLDSTNKTYVNDDEVHERVLRHRDVIRIGLSYFEFDASSDAVSQQQFQKTTKLVKSWIPGVYYTKD